MKRITDTEQLIVSLTENQKSLDRPMKVAQTRLANRNCRPTVENCRDRPHDNLVDEVRSVEEATLALATAIKEAEDTKAVLIKTRATLERELYLKRRSLDIDRNRCLIFRSQYPSATALSGYT